MGERQPMSYMIEFRYPHKHYQQLNDEYEYFINGVQANIDGFELKDGAWAMRAILSKYFSIGVPIRLTPQGEAVWWKDCVRGCENFGYKLLGTEPYLHEQMNGLNRRFFILVK